jgi:transposase InsO family protein
VSFGVVAKLSRFLLWNTFVLAGAIWFILSPDTTSALPLRHYLCTGVTYDAHWIPTMISQDEFRRESLTIEVGQVLRGEDVVGALNQIRQKRGTPKALFCDNGSEFTSQIVDLWAITSRCRSTSREDHKLRHGGGQSFEESCCRENIDPEECDRLVTGTREKKPSASSNPAQLSQALREPRETLGNG